MGTALQEDDYHNRVKKAFQAKFRERIIPSHIIPYLQCLTDVDEERVQAKERQSGAILAADELFNLLIRRPNWSEDLKKALREPNVAHNDLADEIDRFEHEIPVRWDIKGFVDNYGKACFDGNCSTINTESLKDLSDSGTDQGSVDLGNDGEHRLKEPKTVAPLSENEIEQRREQLKLDIMEKIWKFVESGEDVSRAVEYCEKMGLYFKGFEKGSLLFKMQINTLGDLERLRKLVTYGGMKKVLDQELVDKRMEIFRQTASVLGLKLRSIESKVFVHEADLHRCKSLLQSQREDIPFSDNTEGLLMLQFKDEDDVRIQKRIIENLPPVCLKMMEDPFLQIHLPKFFQSGKVVDVLERTAKPPNEQASSLNWSDTGKDGRSDKQLRKNVVELIRKRDLEMKDIRPLYVLFFEWFENQFKEFIGSLETNDLRQLVQTGGKRFMAENFSGESFYVNQKQEHGFCKQLPELNTVNLVPYNADENELSHLIYVGIIQERGGTMEFRSKLLRDAIFAHILDTYNVATTVKVDKYDFLPALLGWFCKDAVNIEHFSSSDSEGYVNYLLASCFVADDPKFGVPVSKIVETEITTLSQAWLLKSATGFTAEAVACIADVLVQGHMTMQVMKRKTQITVQLSNEDNCKQLVYLNALQLLCTLLGNHTELDITLKMFGIKFQKSHSIYDLATFIGMSSLTIALDMSKCEMIAEQLADALSTGSFANVTYLNLGETNTFEQLSGSLGLRYMPKLEIIDLHGCNLRDRGTVFLCQELGLLHSLKEINISLNTISPWGLQEVSNSLSQNHGITALRVQNNNIGPDGALVLAGWLKRLYLLESLNISGCNIEDEGVKYLSKAIVSKVVRQISMRDNHISEYGSLLFFKNMRGKPLLEHLDYGNNLVFADGEYMEDIHEAITDGGMENLQSAFIKFLTEAEQWCHLSMWNCNLGVYRVFQDTEKYTSFKHLVQLCLQGNQIDDAFAEDVACCLMKHCEDIQQINLRHNRIGSRGAVAIADGIAGKLHLKELLMDRNKISVDGVKSLLRETLVMGHVMELDVSCNSLAMTDIENLITQFSLPRMRIVLKSDAEYKQTYSYLRHGVLIHM